MAYSPSNRPKWMTWEDKGGSLFGDKDAAEAIRRGIDPGLILEAVRESDKQRGVAGSADDLAGRLTHAISEAKSGRVANVLGDTGRSGHLGDADIGIYSRYAGGTAGEKAQNIRDAYDVPGALNIGAVTTAGSDYKQTYDSVQGLAINQDRYDEQIQQGIDQKNRDAEAARLAKERHEALMKAQREAAERARLESLKVKTSGTSRVGQGSSAMGIRFQTGDKAGGPLRGTGQFSRTSDKLQTLNV